MAQTMTGNRQNSGSVPEPSSWAKEPVVEMSRAAEELLGRSTRGAFGVSAGLVEAGQRMSDQFFSFSVETAKDLLRLSSDLRASSLSAFRTSYQPWMTGQPALETWQRLLGVATQATTRLAGVIQSSSEGGAERMKDVLILLTDQVKDGAGTLGGSSRKAPGDS